MAEFTGDTNHPILNAFPGLASSVGCSTFEAADEQGNNIMGRNFDFPHFDANDNSISLNFILKMNPAGKYSSINTIDMLLFNYIGFGYTPGCLEQASALQKFAYGLLPNACMDGINEVGLSGAVLSLDVKDGEEASKMQLSGQNLENGPSLLRKILDNCATVDEAIELASHVNYTGALGGDYHLFVADAGGNSAVLEWRYNEFNPIITDAATNFYSGYTDGCDHYDTKGVLTDALVAPNSPYKTYNIGFGHGYSRFKTIVERLDQFRTEVGAQAKMSEQEATQLLMDVAQKSDASDKTSGTQ